MRRAFAVLALLFAPVAAQAQGTSIAGLLASGYELKAAVALPNGGELLYFEGRPASGAPKAIYRCEVSPREDEPALCTMVR